MNSNEDPWFAPKRFGYGAGLPIAWQGWAVTVAYVVAMVLTGLMLERSPVEFWPVAVGLMVVTTIAFVRLAKARTSGEWRWRSGEED